MKGKRKDKKKLEEEGDKVMLTKEMVYASLENFGVLPNSSQIGFLSLKLNNKELEHLNNNISDVKHIIHVDISNNLLIDITHITTFDKIQTLNASSNRIVKLPQIAEEDKFQNLVWLDLSNNKMIEIPQFKVPKLKFLNLSGNGITKYERIEGGHPNLEVFKGNGNKLRSLYFFKDFPKLRELYLNENTITTVTDYENLPELRILKLKDNKIEKFEEESLPELPSLQNIILSKNKLNNMDMIKKFVVFPLLTKINIIETPFHINNGEYTIAELLIVNPKLKIINKVKIEDIHYKEMLLLSEQKWKKSEAERIERERLEKEQAEKEANANNEENS